jgi:hypothetical protein
MDQSDVLLNLARSIDPCAKKKNVNWILAHKNPAGDGLIYWNSEYRNKVSKNLHVFSSLKRYLPSQQRDIGIYRNLSQISDMCASFRLSHFKESKSLLRMTDSFIRGDFSAYFADDDFKIYRVRNIEEAIILGQNTNWRFESRGGQLYRSLAQSGDMYIWFTDAGKFISVIPNTAPIDGFMLNEVGVMTDFGEVYSSFPEVDVTSRPLMELSMASGAKAAFKFDISREWRDFALSISPDTLFSQECVDFCGKFKNIYTQEVNDYVSRRVNMERYLFELMSEV